MSKRPVLTDSAFSSTPRKRAKRPQLPIPSRGTQILTEPASVSPRRKQPEPIVHQLADYNSARINRLLCGTGSRGNRGRGAAMVQPTRPDLDTSAFYEAPPDLTGFQVDNPQPRTRTRKVYYISLNIIYLSDFMSFLRIRLHTSLSGSSIGILICRTSLSDMRTLPPESALNVETNFCGGVMTVLENRCSALVVAAQDISITHSTEYPSGMGIHLFPRP